MNDVNSDMENGSYTTSSACGCELPEECNAAATKQAAAGDEKSIPLHRRKGYTAPYWITELVLERADGATLTLRARKGTWAVQQLVRRFMAAMGDDSLKSLLSSIVQEFGLNGSVDRTLYEFLRFVVDGKLKAYTLNGIRQCLRDDLPYSLIDGIATEVTVRLEGLGRVSYDGDNVLITYGLPGDPVLPAESGHRLLSGKADVLMHAAPATICNHCRHCQWKERGDLIESKCWCSGAPVSVDAYKHRKCPNWKLKDMAVSKAGAEKAADSVRETPSRKWIIRTSGKEEDNTQEVRS